MLIKALSFDAKSHRVEIGGFNRDHSRPQMFPIRATKKSAFHRLESINLSLRLTIAPQLVDGVAYDVSVLSKAERPV